ncbi:hypothetical protein J3R75_001618 [Oligosphaera ethanolica]|uniref:Uncharacterized protein n=1 Tax=Oligosphaera ethanolica TaxID=760260 RepID=A0AAE4AND4_9BACT|nr:hypothetical protein [Oligosphaera ethanolica]
MLMRTTLSAATMVAVVCFVGCAPARWSVDTAKDGYAFGTLLSNPANIERNVQAGITHATICVHWSGAEPEPGEFSEEYFEKVEATIRRFSDAGQQ